MKCKVVCKVAYMYCEEFIEFIPDTRVVIKGIESCPAPSLDTGLACQLLVTISTSVGGWFTVTCGDRIAVCAVGLAPPPTLLDLDSS